MPVNGPYDFKRAVKADARGVVQKDEDIGVGEWAWIDRTLDWSDGDVEHKKRVLMIYLRDPDCKTLCTVWRKFGDEVHGHDLDAAGNISPSVLHQWPYGDPPQERCGFHSMPTKLLDFVDLR